jgi:hypothetical protein
VFSREKLTGTKAAGLDENVMYRKSRKRFRILPLSDLCGEPLSEEALEVWFLIYGYGLASVPLNPLPSPKAN